LPPDEIAADIEVGYRAVLHAGLKIDTLAIAEIIMRHRLMIRAGDVAEAARLDPEQHSRGPGTGQSNS
jgi:hypothetical protein